MEGAATRRALAMGWHVTIGKDTPEPPHGFIEACACQRRIETGMHICPCPHHGYGGIVRTLEVVEE